MKVFDLRCDDDHVFEGWFASDDDFAHQCDRGLVECPVCGSGTVQRMPSAPRLNLGATSGGAAAAAVPGAPRQDIVHASGDPAMQARWMTMVREVMARTEDVGERFADEARRIHHGEAPERGIRGQATREETAALLEDGIEVFALPIPKALKGPLH